MAERFDGHHLSRRVAWAQFFAFVGTVALVSVSFAIRAEQIRNDACKAANVTNTEVNARAKVLRNLIVVELVEGTEHTKKERAKLKRDLKIIGTIPYRRC